MGVVFVGGWYLQSSLMEERYHNDEQAGQIEKLNKEITGQNNQISEQQSQLEQLSVIVKYLLNKDEKV